MKKSLRSTGTSQSILASEKVLLPAYTLPAHPSISLMLMCPEQMMLLGFLW